jgi:hypothetical protein
VILFDLLGAALTLITLAFLGLGGYLLALRLLGREAAQADPLTLAVASLTAATGEAIGIALLLGLLKVLRLELALAVLTLGVMLLLRQARRGGDPFAPLRAIGERTWDHLRQRPALALIALHAAGSELLRGLFRPPLSWDSLMSHLLLTATWLQDKAITVVSGPHPVNFFGLQPDNGSLWFWWWMAPSHSELWVNLASFPHWLLLGLVVGALARELGAARGWPLAAFLVCLLPTVVRFVATQYVDVFFTSLFLSAAFFGLRWAKSARGADAVLTGLALGAGAGAKVLSAPYCAFLALGLLAAARGDWRRRLPQLATALLLTVLLGSYFFVRNIGIGVGATAIACAGTGEGADPLGKVVPTLPRKDSVLALIRPLLASGTLTDVFLGVTRPPSLELGVGPQAAVLLLAGLLFPWFLRTDDRARRRSVWMLWAQIVAQTLFWLTVPFAGNNHVFANLRYLLPAFGIAWAGGIAALERRRGISRGAEVLAIAFCIQGLLQLHAEMPRQVRLILAGIDLTAVALVLAPRLRQTLRRRAPLLVGAGLLAVIAATPWLAAYRVADRGRALGLEFTTHHTPARLSAHGWHWLDGNAGDGTVAVSSAPGHYFVYPAMGPYLERRVVYVNINQADRPFAAQYPNCDPRIDPDPEAWLRNLDRSGARWLYLSRFPEFDFPVEAQWAQARPERFVPRYADLTNLIFEVIPPDVALR